MTDDGRSYREYYPRTELYAADGTAAKNVVLNKGTFSNVQMSAVSTAAKLHTFVLDFSYDNAVWYNHYTSGAPELTKQLIAPSVSARFWRLSSDAVAGAHTEDLVLAASP